MIKETCGAMLAMAALSLPAIATATFMGSPSPITPTDLRAPALAVKNAIGTWNRGTQSLCATDIPGAIVMYCRKDDR